MMAPCLFIFPLKAHFVIFLPYFLILGSLSNNNKGGLTETIKKKKVIGIMRRKGRPNIAIGDKGSGGPKLGTPP